MPAAATTAFQVRVTFSIGATVRTPSASPAHRGRPRAVERQLGGGELARAELVLEAVHEDAVRAAVLVAASRRRRGRGPREPAGFPSGRASASAISAVVAEVNHFVPKSRQPSAVRAARRSRCRTTSEPPVRSVIHCPLVHARRGVARGEPRHGALDERGGRRRRAASAPRRRSWRAGRSRRPSTARARRPCANWCSARERPVAPLVRGRPRGRGGPRAAPPRARAAVSSMRSTRRPHASHCTRRGSDVALGDLQLEEPARPRARRARAAPARSRAGRRPAARGRGARGGARRRRTGSPSRGGSWKKAMLRRIAARARARALAGRGAAPWSRTAARFALEGDPFRVQATAAPRRTATDPGAPGRSVTDSTSEMRWKIPSRPS